MIVAEATGANAAKAANTAAAATVRRASPCTIVNSPCVRGLLIVFVIRKVALARKAPSKTGWEEMLGVVAEVRVPLDPEGQVFARGALWRARLEDGEGPLGIGDRVRVVSVEGLTLLVEPLEQPAGTTKSREGVS